MNNSHVYKCNIMKIYCVDEPKDAIRAALNDDSIGWNTREKLTLVKILNGLHSDINSIRIKDHCYFSSSSMTFAVQKCKNGWSITRIN